MANLSQQRRERMLDFLEKIKSKNKDDEEILLSIGEIENALIKTRYGIVFEEHSEDVYDKLATDIPVFEEDKSKELNETNGSYNFILEGDNLHSLYLMQKSLRNKVDVIYADPPYNTGSNTWRYNNDIVDANDTYRHSKWLSFMRNRLVLAKNLLKETGTIVVTIDDYEVYTLGLLMDEIFGEQNKIGVIVVESNPRGRTSNKFYATSHEYYLIYAKNADLAEIENLPLTEDQAAVFKYEDEESKYRLLPLRKSGAASRRKDRPKQFFPIYVDPKTLKGTLVKTEGYDEVYPIDEGGEERCWRLGRDKVERYLEDGNIQINRKSGNGNNKYVFQTKDRIKSGRKAKTVWVSPLYDASAYGSNLLLDIFKKKSFDYPKSLNAVRDYLYTMIRSNKEAVVVDFFAGSGTTGHAVLEMNEKDGGNRRFVMCTNNENKIAEEVTYPRIKTVITGKKPDGSNYSEHIPANLKYYKTKFVPKDTENLTKSLMSYIDEMIQLEYGVKIDREKYVSILTEEDADELEKKWGKYDKIAAIFISRNVLLTGKQKDLFYQKDCYIIPDYYFREELREAGEA